MVTPAAKRKAVAHLVDAHGMSERRACKAIGCCRMTVRYQTARADDASLRQRMRAIAQERRRFGYRRLHVLLKREGYLINHKKLFRLYREERLAVRRRGGRKRAIGTRAPMTVPMAPNDRWSLDFVSDTRRRQLWVPSCILMVSKLRRLCPRNGDLSEASIWSWKGQDLTHAQRRSITSSVQRRG